MVEGWQPRSACRASSNGPNGSMTASSIERTTRSPRSIRPAGTSGKTAEAWAAARYGLAAPGLRITTVERAWVAANDTFAADRADAPAETLRLAWVVTFETQGALADRLRSVELWLDGSDGAVLGSDVVE